MRLLTPPGVFTPLSDSWLLAELVCAEPALEERSVLDVCTGSGAIAIAAAKAGALAVTAIDASRRAVLAARLNAQLNGARVRVLHGDLLGPVAGERFDLVVSNPPYVPTGDGSGPGPRHAWDGGHDGRVLIDRLCDQLPQRLKPGGAALIVHSSLCGEGATLERLRAAGLQAEVVERRRGPLGPLMRARMPAYGDEEVLVLRGEAPAA
jgi:release factor glutamine methyltransferase